LGANGYFPATKVVLFGELGRNKILSKRFSLNWGTICTLVEMIAADGKKCKIQAADARKALELETSEAVVSIGNYLPEKEKGKELNEKL
jgi:DNA polymerase IIIc chi subunit